ncbi:MAG: NAD(+) synthase [Dysgonamonadaceae bacterium]|jgi:NAD+ synthase|nr:NAD(+) synthase [Dysgonamonadaceae bacterium]MDD3309032.1 NAD(+) synthase [Dysgonamonadaceae bacterium]MDD4399383.1 NAD(+) synthase [Dysgonamonadaceae bacterium]
MNTIKSPFSRNILKINDLESLCNMIVGNIQDSVLRILHRRGGVVGISGGIDSSVTLALTIRALGNKNVLGVIMPDADSSPESELFAQKLADKFNIKTILENVTPALEGFNCYQRRDEAISRVIPEFNPNTDKAKIVIQQNMNEDIPPVFSVVVITSDGKEMSRMLPAKEYLQIVAATNFKQRSRMSMLYYHAERLHYAVIGTANKHEVDQGFFVKYGDGGVDIMPIGKLYKTQIYQLAEYLDIPQEIINRTPTTDTYSAKQTQVEFFFQMPYELLDLVDYGWENDYEPTEVALILGKKEREIRNMYKNLERKAKTTDYLRMHPVFFE